MSPLAVGRAENRYALLMDGPDGLVAYIFTFHQLSLVISIMLGLIAMVPYAIAIRSLKAQRRALGGVTLFIGVTLAFHSFFSWHLRLPPFSVEVVGIAMPIEETVPDEAPVDQEPAAPPAPSKDR